jgi:hypothetical protein
MVRLSKVLLKTRFSSLTWSSCESEPIHEMSDYAMFQLDVCSDLVLHRFNLLRVQSTGCETKVRKFDVSGSINQEILSGTEVSIRPNLL